MAHYSSSLDLILSCNASQKGTGVVLSCLLPNGVEKHITSRDFSMTEQKYSIIIKEALAIFWVV